MGRRKANVSCTNTSVSTPIYLVSFLYKRDAESSRHTDLPRESRKGGPNSDGFTIPIV
jgi:hypothetical protein